MQQWGPTFFLQMNAESMGPSFVARGRVCICKIFKGLFVVLVVQRYRSTAPFFYITWREALATESCCRSLFKSVLYSLFPWVCKTWFPFMQ